MSKDQLWVVKHFSKIVKKYGGKYIGVYRQRIIGAAYTPKQLIKGCKIRNPEDIYFFKVPREEELVCLL